MPMSRIEPAIGSSQNESAFRRGNAMSAAPIISGITKLPKPGEHGHDDQEDHQRRVVRDQDVERLRVEVLRPRLGQLGAEQHRQEAADDEEEHRRDQVLHPDHLVVGVRAEVVAPAAARRGRSGPRAASAAGAVVEPVVEGAEARRGSRAGT